MSLVGGSVAQVFLAHAPEELRAGRLGEFTAKILGGLLKTGVGPMLFAALVAGPLAGILFGKSWARAGELVAWMTPWFILQFLASPVSMVMHIRMQQVRMLLLTIFGVVLRVGAVYLGAKLAPSHMVECYAVAAAVYYLILNVVFYGVSGCGVRLLLQHARKVLVVPLGWIGFGVLMRLGMEWGMV